MKEGMNWEWIRDLLESVSALTQEYSLCTKPDTEHLQMYTIDPLIGLNENRLANNNTKFNSIKLTNWNFVIIELMYMCIWWAAKFSNFKVYENRLRLWLFK